MVRRKNGEEEMGCGGWDERRCESVVQLVDESVSGSR